MIYLLWSPSSPSYKVGVDEGDHDEEDKDGDDDDKIDDHYDDGDEHYNDSDWW